MPNIPFTFKIKFIGPLARKIKFNSNTQHFIFKISDQSLSLITIFWECDIVQNQTKSNQNNTRRDKRKTLSYLSLFIFDISSKTNK